MRLRSTPPALFRLRRKPAEEAESAAEVPCRPPAGNVLVTLMPLTKPFSETVRARAQRDPQFRAAMLREALVALIEGDAPGVKVLLRDAINATLGFQVLAAAVGRKDKSLM